MCVNACVCACVHTPLHVCTFVHVHAYVYVPLLLAEVHSLSMMHGHACSQLQELRAYFALPLLSSLTPTVHTSSSTKHTRRKRQ